MKNKVYITKYILILISIFSFGYSCKSEKEDEQIEVNRVLLVYLGGDNNLSGETDQKLTAISAEWKSDGKSEILVYQDSRDSPGRLLQVDGKGSTKLLKQYGEENSADAKVFGRVINETKALYPQAQFNLLIFSHASGWLPKGSLESPTSGPNTRSIITDGKDQMELKDFAAAIPDKAFQTITFEACFMSGIEVAYQLKDKASYILASSAEILSPGFTSIYSQEIGKLVYNNDQQFMQAAFNYFNMQSDYMQSASFSLIKTENLGTLADYIKQNCDFTKDIVLSEIQHFDRYSYRLFFDFEDYYARLMPENKKEGLHKLLESTVVYKLATKTFMPGYNGFTINKHSGLTTYIMQDEFPDLNKNYTYLEWYKAIQ